MDVDVGAGSEELRTSEGAATTPYPTHGTDEAVAAVGGHGGLDDFEGLAERGDFEHVEASAH